MGGLAILYAARLGARLAIAAAMSWGLAWIAVGRLTDEPQSTLVGLAAAAAALLVLAITATKARDTPAAVAS